MSEEQNHSNRPRPLLVTKLDPPMRVRGLVARPGLLAELVASPQRLTLIAAPAGWGKSTVAAEWSDDEAEHRPFAFVRLDPEDDDPTSFWAYVVMSIGQVVAGVRDAVNSEALRTPGIDPTRSLVPDLINGLHDLNEPVVLVLDDYHTITNPEIHRSVSFLIDNAPRCLHIVIATRSDPPFPLAGYRVAQTMSEVRVAQLRMSTDETRRFLRQRFAVELTTQEAGIVCERTEGWPAGVQLAGLSLVNEPDHSGFIAAFAGDDRNVADYLATEVLNRQPEERRQFLLKTSVLDEFSAEVCNFLLETDDSAAMLEEIERDNLFLVSLDSQRMRYRYHHLLRDWLRHEHQLAFESEAIHVLHRRAAQWMRTSNFPERAIGHLIKVGDVDQAAQLMGDLAAAQPGGEQGFIHRWIDDIPDGLVRQHPALALWMVAPSVASGDYSEALNWIDTAEEAISNVESERRSSLTTDVEGWRAVFAFLTGNLDEAAERCQAILAAIPPATAINAVYAQGFLGAALFATSGPEAALPYLQRSAAGRRRLSISDVGITAQLAAVHAELGNWEQAETVAIEALSLAVRPGAPYPHNAAAHYALAEVHQHRGDTERAIADAEQGLSVSRDWVEPGYYGWGLFVMAQLVSDSNRQRQLLTEAKQCIAAANGQQRLLHRIEAAERGLTRRSARTTATGMVLDPLTSRELDMLRLMRGNLSIREIGSELFISHNTAKGYAKTIYQKLGVHSRADAVDAATAADVI